MILSNIQITSFQTSLPLVYQVSNVREAHAHMLTDRLT